MGKRFGGVQVGVQGSQALEETDSQGRFVLRTDGKGSRPDSGRRRRWSTWWVPKWT